MWDDLEATTRTIKLELFAAIKVIGAHTHSRQDQTDELKASCYGAKEMIDRVTRMHLFVAAPY